MYKDREARRENQKLYYQNNKENWKISNERIETKYKLLKRTAANQNREMTISFSEFVAIRALPCNYCGVTELSSTGYGLDRKDNSVGYILSNVVPCCRVCNVAKNNQTFEEFAAWIQRLINYRGNKMDIGLPA